MSWRSQEQVTFRDHHRYEQRDIDRLLDLKRQTGADGFITTEKDAINLGALSAQLQPLRTATLRIELESPERVMSEIASDHRTAIRLQSLAPA